MTRKPTIGAILCIMVSLTILVNPHAAEGPKDASEFTKKANAEFAKQLNFGDTQDFEDAKRGFIAPLVNDGVLKNDKGEVVWDGKAFQFPQTEPAPDSVNPSLWRQARVLSNAGLFKVIDRMYQVRSQDISNITFIEGDTGIIIIDPLVTAEAAKAGLELYYQHRPKKPVKAVIYTHSHVDHYGGVRGVITDEDVKSGRTKVIAPVMFLEEAISENVLVGTAMMRRATYSYGLLLPKNVKGDIGDGLGVGGTTGTVTLIAPTDYITKTGEKMTIDGIEFEFMLAPDSEAPSEMHFYIPSMKALCTAENCVHTLHNFYTLRGAKTRDITKWVGYLNETLDRWGDEIEVFYAPHTWPIWGRERIVDHIEKYRDVFRYIHDQTVYLANNGYTMNEIGNMITLPDELAKNWATRGYYGSVNHNARAVYNFYLGYFDGNPANLDPYAPADLAKRYVKTLGGADAVMKVAREAMAEGDYRWAAEILKQAVFADPKNQAARDLQADAFEQLGYQAENATWRGFYLVGAQELRNGVKKLAVANPAGRDTQAAMPVEMFLDYFAVRLNARHAAGKTINVNFSFPGGKDNLALSLNRQVLNYRSRPHPKPDLELSINRDDLRDVFLGHAKLDDLVKAGKAKAEGNAGKLGEILSCVDEYNFWFNIVTPN